MRNPFIILILWLHSGFLILRIFVSMPIPGHRLPPPLYRKNTTTAIIRWLLRQFFRITTFWTAPKGNKNQSPLGIPNLTVRNRVLNKNTFSCEKHVRKKHQSRSFDSHHINAYISCLLSFPMTGFRRRICILRCIQRLVSSWILTTFPFHRLYLA